MNKDNAKDYLPLVQALSEGKVIQRRTWTDFDKWEWRDVMDVDFSRYAPSDHRIKPEPEEILAARYRDGRVTQVRYREVIE